MLEGRDPPTTWMACTALRRVKSLPPSTVSRVKCGAGLLVFAAILLYALRGQAQHSIRAPEPLTPSGRGQSVICPPPTAQNAKEFAAAAEGGVHDVFNG